VLPHVALPSVPVGTVVRIRGLRGPWRHLGRGWVILAREPEWEPLVPKVVEWAAHDDEASRVMTEEMVDVEVDGKVVRREWKSREFLAVFYSQYLAAQEIRIELLDAGAWMDPRCCHDETDPDPFFRVTILRVED
jgi:hypothetical protein